MQSSTVTLKVVCTPCTGDKNIKISEREVNLILCVLARLLAEEEEKMKALMALQEEQEEYILKTKREKQELRQEMEAKSRALEEAQRQLEEVRANRHRVDQDVVVSPPQPLRKTR